MNPKIIVPSRTLKQSLKKIVKWNLTQGSNVVIYFMHSKIKKILINLPYSYKMIQTLMGIINGSIFHFVIQNQV